MCDLNKPLSWEEPGKWGLPEGTTFIFQKLSQVCILIHKNLPRAGEPVPFLASYRFVVFCKFLFLKVAIIIFGTSKWHSINDWRPYYFKKDSILWCKIMFFHSKNIWMRILVLPGPPTQIGKETQVLTYWWNRNSSNAFYTSIVSLGAFAYAEVFCLLHWRVKK